MAARLFARRLIFNISASSFLTRPKLKCETTVSRGFRLASILFDVLQIRMPSLSPTMQHGTIVKWHKQEGDTLAPGDVLCDIQTDKAVLGFEVDEEGVLAKILKPDNSSGIEVGVLIALVTDVGADWKNVEVPTEAGATAIRVQASYGGAAAPAGHHDIHSYGPAVRSILEVYDVKPELVTPTGPQGRLLKGDVLRYIQEKALQPASIHIDPLPRPAGVAAVPPKPKVPPQWSVGADAASYTDIELTTMRSVIAKRLTMSKTTIPHAYCSTDCDVGNLLKLRKELNESGVKVSVNDFMIKAAAIALQKMPQMNAIWTGDSPRLLSSIDISIAVAMDTGLITPIIKDAIGMGVEEISLKMKELSIRARAGKLLPEEFQGGSFTISNLGMFGITSFSAVINPPQACIMAVGSSRLVLDVDGRPQNLISITISSDARIIDDAMAAEFLQHFQEVVENPGLLLSHSRSKELDKLFAK